MIFEKTIVKLAEKHLQGVDQSFDTEIYCCQGINNKELILYQKYYAFGENIPAGFTWDGASTPAVARFIIPKFYRVLKASCRHDYGCRKARSAADRLREDVIFFLMCYKLERLAGWRCIAGLLGVRIGAALGVGSNY